MKVLHLDGGGGGRVHGGRGGEVGVDGIGDHVVV